MNDLQNVILVGGRYAGLKLQVPAGKKVINIPDEKGPKLEVVGGVNAAMQVADAIAHQQFGSDLNSSDLRDMDNPYLLHPVSVVFPRLNYDMVSLVLGVPPGVSASDSLMAILTGYCNLMEFSDDTQIGPLMAERMKQH